MGVRTGREYLAGLRDGRALYVKGQRVSDVTAYPPYRGVLAELAAHFDRHCEGPLAPLLTFPSPADDQPVMNSWLEVRTWEDMQARITGERLRAERTYGQMGRLPDFMAAFITDLASVAHVLGAKDPAFGEHARRYHAYCRDRDLALTHTLVDPQVDRSRGPEAQGALRLVRETDAGIVVRGARMLSTLAPLADELYVGPYMPRQSGQEAYCLSFAVPVAHPGLKFIAREPYDTGATRYDRPLSSRFDEGDAIAIFEDALIPWERVFVAGDLATYNAMTPNFPGYLALQAVIRGAAKLNFLIGVASKVARAVGRSELARYQELVGELIGYAELADGLIEATAREVYAAAAQVAAPPVQRAPEGALFISPERGLVGISAIRLFYTQVNPRAAEVVRLLASSGLIMTPTQADFENPEIAPALGEYLRGRDMDARERVQIMKLAWDAVGTEFGSRQNHYELFFAGDPVTARQVYWQVPRRARCEALIDRLLAESR